jgi:hypothetical protein
MHPWAPLGPYDPQWGKARLPPVGTGAPNPYDLGSSEDELLTVDTNALDPGTPGSCGAEILLMSVPNPNLPRSGKAGPPRGWFQKGGDLLRIRMLDPKLLGILILIPDSNNLW